MRLARAVALRGHQGPVHCLASWYVCSSRVSYHRGCIRQSLAFTSPWHLTCFPMFVPSFHSPSTPTALATGSADKTARVWDVRASRCERGIRGFDNAVNSVAWGQQGAVLYVAEANRVWSRFPQYAHSKNDIKTEDPLAEDCCY